MENIKQLLSLAIKASVHAGEEIRKVYGTAFSIEIKDDKSPLTEADKRSHAAIVKGLEPSSLPVLSEEGRSIPYAERKSWDYFWMVDPLDGTKEFIKRNGEFTVNIALVHEGAAIMGVIYAPIIDTLYFGSMGMGSFKLEAASAEILALLDADLDAASLVRQAQTLPMPRNGRAFTVVASRSHLSDETSAFIDSLRSEHGQLEMISKGSSLKLCLVAEGAADVYPRFAPTMEWDTAAGQAIAVAAGFKVVQTESRELVVYNKEDLLNPWFIVE